jgi:hypothetical protein
MLWPCHSVSNIWKINKSRFNCTLDDSTNFDAFGHCAFSQSVIWIPGSIAFSAASSRQIRIRHRAGAGTPPSTRAGPPCAIRSATRGRVLLNPTRSAGAAQTGAAFSARPHPGNTGKIPRRHQEYCRMRTERHSKRSSHSGKPVGHRALPDGMARMAQADPRGRATLPARTAPLEVLPRWRPRRPDFCVAMPSR